MTALISAEWLRLTTTRLWLWGLLCAIGTGALVGLLAFVGPENFEPPLPGLHTAEGTQVVLGLLGFTTFVPALLGTGAVAAEYRHRTVTTTALFAPRRWTSLAAKLAAYTAGGLAYGLTAATVAGAGLFGAAAVKGVALGLPASTVAELLGRVALTMAVYTLLGVAVGALLRNQVAALVVVGLYAYMVETVLLLIPGVNTLYPFLPGGATAALTGFTFLAEAVATQTGASATHLLPAPAGGAVLLGYALLAAVVAVAAPLRRDIP
ncbi:ABC transporter permease [Nonomuraea muscovyensis]|jgi:ABC-type transport system involved in multi-copper enzyme maturation permease subunit|uniref:ABC-type transport system involved in multi-copper enzyme maturation permease subunit n=1 Tax=Nonomuraea muscovyensis TaxID=1124761 RepID=A0A7X0BZG6_9ACTN|nr:ABC transporter permease [Nonomuraea muscovyensis]MBB6345592.1 ABC-type transport system involved in multi-copper enzyme maturation permease subunit [Nonomuraea muscovyensis]MDF2704765.1 transporter permease [Nonomuraea muscovyensis]